MIVICLLHSYSSWISLQNDIVQVVWPGSGVFHLVVPACDAAYGGVNVALFLCQGRLLENQDYHCGYDNDSMVGTDLGRGVVHVSTDVLEPGYPCWKIGVFVRGVCQDIDSLW